MKTEGDPAMALARSFARRHGERHAALAMHAAVPLGLTPELLNVIRVNFVPGPEWIAEADLLLSPLCEETGGGFYQMTEGVRDLLLDELMHDAEYGPRRAARVGDLLAAYAGRELARPQDEQTRWFLMALEWAGLAFARPAEAAGQLAAALGRGLEGGAGEALRVAGVAQALSGPLAGEGRVLLYAAGVSRLARGQAEAARRFFAALGDVETAAAVAGVTLPAPAALLRGTEGAAPPAAGQGRTVEDALRMAEEGTAALSPEADRPALPTRLSPSAARVLRVFLSSTAQDLAACRDRVRDAILQLGQLPVGIETFAALATAPAAECQKKAAEADVVVVMVAFRYGHVPSVEEGGDGVRSIAWLEVLAATAAGKPVFAFLLDPQARWRPQHRESDLLHDAPEASREEVLADFNGVEAFRSYLQANCTCDAFLDEDDLARKVAATLAKHAEAPAAEKPRTWRPLVCHPLQPVPHFAGRLRLRGPLAEWARVPAPRDRVVALVAMGGVGKTALAERVLADLGEHGAGLMAWSFYEGPRAEDFLRTACEYFSGEAAAPAGGLLERLQAALGGELPHLLILDGLERLQADGATGWPRGQLHDLEMRRLLRWLAAGTGTKARALITSRSPLVDLEGWKDGGYREEWLEDLEPAAAIAVLRGWGVKGDDDALAGLAQRLGHHALSVAVLGSYLGKHWDGDPTRAPVIDLKDLAADDPRAAKLRRILSKLPPAERARMTDRLRRYPDDFLEPKFRWRVFRGVGLRMQVELEPVWLEPAWAMFVAVESLDGTMNTQECVRLFTTAGELDMKIGSSGKVEQIFTLGLSGLAFSYQPNPPRALPVRAARTYFQVNRTANPNEWGRVRQTMSLAVRLNERLIKGSIDGAESLTIKSRKGEVPARLILFLLPAEAAGEAPRAHVPEIATVEEKPDAGGRPKVYLSYRPHDSAAVAEQIRAHLSRAGIADVTTELQTERPGAESIRRVVGSADVVLAVIGPHWLQGSTPRISIELEHASRSKRPVIPVLVNGATQSDLSPELAPLAQRQAFVLRPDEDVGDDLSRLALLIREVAAEPPVELGAGAVRERLLSEAAAVLARLFGGEPEARSALETAGVPVDRLPPWGASPLNNWRACLAEIDRGLIPEGVLGVLRAALIVYPANRDLPALIESWQAHLAGPLKILFLSASPMDAGPRVGVEHRTILEHASVPGSAVRIELRPFFAAEPERLIEVVVRERPAVVHFCGHGGVAGPEGEGGEARLSPEALREALGSKNLPAESRPVRCVVLSACYSDPVAEAVGKYADVVVGTKGEIADEAAVAFVKGFYGAIAAGRPVANAIELGRAHLRLAAPSVRGGEPGFDPNLVSVRTTEGVDLHRLVLGGPAR